MEAVRTRERTAFHGKPCCTRKCHAFAAWKGSRPFGWTVQRKIIVAKAMQLGGKRGCGNEREDLGNLFDRVGEALKVSQIPQDVGWVAVGQMVVAKGRERERGGGAW